MACFDFSAAAVATTTDGNESTNIDNGTSHPPIETRKLKFRARKMLQGGRKGKSEAMEIGNGMHRENGNAPGRGIQRAIEGMEIENGMGSENGAGPERGTPTATNDDEMQDVSLTQQAGDSDLNAQGRGPGRPNTPTPTISIAAAMAVDTYTDAHTDSNAIANSTWNSNAYTDTTTQTRRTGANAIPVVSTIN